MNINTNFKLPISYTDSNTLKDTIINDLELINSNEESNPIYHYYFNISNDNQFAKEVCKQLSTQYSSNEKFLNDNQKLIKTFKITNYSNSEKKYDDIITIWDEIKNDTGFKEKYQYIDWQIFEFLNTNDQFLLIHSIYQLLGPIFTFITPIIILIVPFFILKIQNIEINFSEYTNVIKVICQNHTLGKLFTLDFKSLDNQQLLYTIISAGFYLFSIYQNILTFIRFNHNMKKIHQQLSSISKYLSFTINHMDEYRSYASSLETHFQFNQELETQRNILFELNEKLENITEYKITNIKKTLEIGKILKLFYLIYDDPVLNKAFDYSFGFNGYIDCLMGLKTNVTSGIINYCTFINDKSNNQIEENYYGALKDKTPIKNTINLNKNLTITGPNASGKTTILKSALINIIFSQQFGCGFYSNASFQIYKYIHCYLNIPDTSGRDSLFQAEARRGKEILDLINEYPNQTHFCIFDELYSGTNPDEAVTSAFSFLNYITKNKNVTCLLTTHFIKLCKKLKTNDEVRNIHMVTKKKENNLIFTYKIKKGISKVKGGMNVLSKLDYPEEIINSK
jgi:hypothetical protein